ncbi:hypothetical protein [Paenibacillus borealis]|uniref:hypothetical protein n=1 Tax=Paenibacillus borealis TaxID=160799 RepID=UPI000B2F684A|nr:hypothetical protein [Paenibacillus borealis]
MAFEILNVEQIRLMDEFILVSGMPLNPPKACGMGKTKGKIPLMQPEVGGTRKTKG